MPSVCRIHHRTRQSYRKPSPDKQQDIRDSVSDAVPPPQLHWRRLVLGFQQSVDCRLRRSVPRLPRLRQTSRLPAVVCAPCRAALAPRGRARPDAGNSGTKQWAGLGQWLRCHRRAGLGFHSFCARGSRRL